MPTPEHKPSKTNSYCQAARFASEVDAGQAYFHAEEALFRAPACDLSAYRLQLEQIWHVAVLGVQPPRYLDRQLRKVLAAGEPVGLPEEVTQLLLERRAQATELGPWVEGHHWPGKRL